MDSRLLDIQRLQFEDLPAAESRMLIFFQEKIGENVSRVELTPRPQSLNSINGFITFSSGERNFFKTHTEQGESLQEYYQIGVLEEAGYPVVSPEAVRNRPGEQFALYKVITLPLLFDLVEKLESGETGVTDETSLLAAQVEYDRKVYSVYENTLRPISPEQNQAAPIHQLFSTRLRANGRLGEYYLGKTALLDGKGVSFEELASKKWRINGAEYAKPLGQILSQARSLEPNFKTFAVTGHGDAHNGNIYYDPEVRKYLLFDAAFGGRHNPLLDLTKPLFHNIFARWMYFPDKVERELELTLRISDEFVDVEHTFQPSEFRRESLNSKVKNTLIPTLELLAAHRALESNWRERLRSSLFCCPFLTVNLFAPFNERGTLAERYGWKIKLLGLSMAVELGSERIRGENAITPMIDSILELHA